MWITHIYEIYGHRLRMNSLLQFQIQTPILTSNDCEGAGEVFTVIPASKKTIEVMKKESVQVKKILTESFIPYYLDMYFFSFHSPSQSYKINLILKSDSALPQMRLDNKHSIK